MATVPVSLACSSLALSNQAIAADPWPCSLVPDINMIMGGGEKSLKNFHLPHLHHQHHRKQARDVPRGCLAIKVGQGEEQQRFVVPVIYFNHPLFIQLLKEAEEEYGFDQKGTITIPCHVDEFRYVQGMIDREKSIQHHHAGCFRV
ncbi:hypothetical protein OIU85_020533 [Salix viminalis]|uniref:Uncharacterized protein n=1 Tax=Salix viminalis TaxID=40686 RepID=A0A6N2LDY1_SALVM|nr:hypothetical protein OIU85_020533 [Salix viminalis]